MDRLYNVTVVPQQPDRHPTRLIAPALKKMGLLWVTHNDETISGMASEEVLGALERSRNFIVIARELSVVEAKSKTIDAATWLKQQAEKDKEVAAAATNVEPEKKKDVESEKNQEKDSAKKKQPKKKKTPKKKQPKQKKKKKVQPKKKKKKQKKAKNKRKTARKSKRRNRKKR